MKKTFKYILLIIIMCLFPNIVYAETPNVSIEGINKIESTIEDIEKSPATANATDINLNLTFSKLNDSIKYKIILNNKDNETYYLSNSKTFSTSKYLEYKLEAEDNSLSINPNSKKIFYLTVSFKNAVPNNLLVNNKYTETNNYKLTILKNPNTFNNFTIILIILLITTGLVIIFRKKRMNTLAILIIGLSLIPLNIYAASILELNLNVIVNIEKGSVYRDTTNTVNNNDQINNIGDYSNDYNNLEKTSFIRHITDFEGNIESSEACTRIIDQLICITGSGATRNENSHGPSNKPSYNKDSIYYEQNKQLLINFFGEDNCRIYTERNTEKTSCQKQGHICRANQKGEVSCDSKNWRSHVYADGSSREHELTGGQDGNTGD